MILFRILCAVIMGWVMNVALTRPQAVELLTEVEEMATVMPLAAGIVGFFYLGKRQGRGVVIGLANGAVAGLISVALGVFLHLVATMWSHLIHGLVANFEEFMRILGLEAGPVVAATANIPLLAVIAGMCIAAGGATEVLHWCFAYLRRIRREDEEEII